MNNIIERVWKRDSMVNIEDLRGSAFQNEKAGHTFIISGIDGDGETVILSGTVAGSFLRPDGTTVAIVGSASDGKVSVTLPENCYDVPGKFGMTIFLTENSEKTAIYAAIGAVARTSSSTAAPGTTADVVDLVNAIATAVATIPASYTDLMAAVAPTYSTSALYAVGSYAWYSGKLYRCTTAITSGETWTSTHWTQANLGSDVSDLKSAINKHADANYDGYAYAMTSDDFELGKWSENTGNANERTAWIRSGFLDNTKLYTITILGSTTRVEVLKYNLDGTYASDWTEYNSGIVTIQPSDSYKYKLNLRTYPESDISNIQAFLDANVTIYYGDLFSAIRNELNNTEQTVLQISGEVSILNDTVFGSAVESIPFERGKWSDVTGNPNTNPNWVRTVNFLEQGETLVFSVANGAQAFLLEYSGAGVYSGNYVQYNPGSYRIVLPSDNKYKLNARNNPEVEITSVSVFLSNYLSITYESTPGIIQKLDAITPPDSFWSVPDTVYALVGQESRIYFNEIFTTTQPGFYEITVTNATYTEVTYSSDYISLNFTAAKSCTISISYQDVMRNEIGVKTITVTAISTLSTIPAKKYMFLGDSLTNEGTMASTFKTLMGNSATMYGTRTSKSTPHEGRPGWGITHYCDNASYNGITNPFYNPSTGKFDFSYYMTNNPSFADVDVVNIFLGRNNGYQTYIINRLYNEIIASIHAFNPNIIVTLMCAYNTATDNSGCGATLQNTYRFIYNGKVYNQAFIEFFASKTSEKIFIVPQNLNFDNYFDYARTEQNATPYDSTDKRIVFTDNVHPATSGYTAWANTLFANLQQILNN